MRIDTDRLLVVALALLGTCVVSVSVADPSAAPAASPASAASASASQPAAPASNAAAATAVKPAVTVNADAIQAQAAEEKRLLAAGYKPEMHNGQKVWCRKEEELGSHLGGHKVCDTAERIKAITHDAQEQTELDQRKQINPNGH